VKVF